MQKDPAGKDKAGEEEAAVVGFGEVVAAAALERFEVSRLFAAMLQLINNRCAFKRVQGCSCVWVREMSRRV